MRHQNTVFHTMLKHLPWGEFERLVEAHRADQRQRGFTTKTQIVAMIYAQLSGALSLREIESGLSSHETRLYHLGIGRVRRSSLADANAPRPSALFSDLFAVLVTQANRALRRKLDGTTYLIDSTPVGGGAARPIGASPISCSRSGLRRRKASSTASIPARGYPMDDTHTMFCQPQLERLAAGG